MQIKNFRHGVAKRLAEQRRDATEWQVRKQQIIQQLIEPTAADLARLDDELVDEYLEMAGDGDIPDEWPLTLQQRLRAYQERVRRRYDLPGQPLPEPMPEDSAVADDDSPAGLIFCFCFGLLIGGLAFAFYVAS